jgi:hypothetical protein
LGNCQNFTSVGIRTIALHVIVECVSTNLGKWQNFTSVGIRTIAFHVVVFNALRCLPVCRISAMRYIIEDFKLTMGSAFHKDAVR